MELLTGVVLGWVWMILAGTYYTHESMSDRLDAVEMMVTGSFAGTWQFLILVASLVMLPFVIMVTELSGVGPVTMWLKDKWQLL